jgi:SAM-dependent methyltransferase
MDGIETPEHGTSEHERSRGIWDSCAAAYERQIVAGHPDIYAYECFEEDLLDRILAELAECQGRPLKLIDVGCGSGRLHVRYGAKTAPPEAGPEDDPLARLRAHRPDFAFDPLLAGKLAAIRGIDFSTEMLALARSKLADLGLSRRGAARLVFEQGSAFELAEEPSVCLPVAVSLVNSIGVMQGEDGARALFASMRRAVERAGGVAIISCYQKEYLSSYGLGQYESTLDVSGQPTWLVPSDFALRGLRLVAVRHTRAWSRDESIEVDVIDQSGRLVERSVRLFRSASETASVLESGHIRTFSGYESRWYSFGQIGRWIETLWPAESVHLETRRLDALRAEPGQLAILDASGVLRPKLLAWGVVP